MPDVEKAHKNEERVKIIIPTLNNLLTPNRSPHLPEGSKNIPVERRNEVITQLSLIASRLNSLSIEGRAMFTDEIKKVPIKEVEATTKRIESCFRVQFIDQLFGVNLSIFELSHTLFSYICKNLFLNYLAHIFLSGNKRGLQVGNFIGDFVKGNQYQNYPATIKDGILLHRQLDSFTDSNPLFIEATSLLKPSFGRYSAIITDIYFDYLLASDFRRYSQTQTLNAFAYNFYLSVLLHYRWLPKRVKEFIFHFIGTNRLGKYSCYSGIQESLAIMALFKIPELNPQQTVDFLRENEAHLREIFNKFMPQIILYSQDLINE